MKDRNTDQVNFKCPVGLLQLIEEDVDRSGEFRNRSEWIIAALRFYYDHRIETRRPEEDYVSNTSKEGVHD